MTTIDDQISVMTKVRGEILAGLERERRAQYEKEVRLAMQNSAFTEEEKIIFLTNEINIRAARKAEEESNVPVEANPEP